jgi:GMP synthase (glutamine-hydrolysing)
MKRVLLIQHEAFDPFGTLDPLLKREGIRIRYVNFAREPDARPSLDSYDGLILMGGEMAVYESHLYEHIRVEMRLVEDALKRDLPVLGICLGAQIIAHVLGAKVALHSTREMGWSKIRLTPAGDSDPVMGGFDSEEFVFQSHQDSFEIPTGADHLVESDVCASQGFRYGRHIYGFQFHLEIDRPTIRHWIDTPSNIKFFEENPGLINPEQVLRETDLYLPRSTELSESCFLNFLRLGGAQPPRIRLGSGR